MLETLSSFLILIVTLIHHIECLYPRESPTREVKSLNGIWTFRVSPHFDPELGFREEWFKEPLEKNGQTIPMPVPSSFNDVTQNKTIRDHVGWAWYQTTFYAHNHWKSDSKSIILRFDSVHYVAIVYVNGVQVTKHIGGHLPFEVDITKVIVYDLENLVTVAVNNTLTPQTLPQGNIEYPSDPKRYPKGFYKSSGNFDFFNYAGIHRNVHLSVLPRLHINDVTLTSTITPDKALVHFNVEHGCESEDSCLCVVKVFEPNNRSLIAKASECFGSLRIANPKLWWPFKMHQSPGHQYDIVISLITSDSINDEYRLKYGIRSIELTSSEFLINGKAVYFQGFGKHEDSNIRGRGLDIPLLVKDFNLIKWLGANVFRTTHYPYSEELMDMADSEGIMVINECPAVGLNRFDSQILALHLQSIKELIQRDKNRPSVVMWSIANEPQSQRPESKAYFKSVVSLTKSLDSSRPITAAIAQPYQTDHLAQYLDFLMVNRYYAWYSDTGCTEVIQMQIIEEFEEWFKKHRKLMLISEYGADTISGLHSDPSFVFTEDYQVEFIQEYHKAFDILRSKGFFVGEMIWNFADFMTSQGTARVYGNRKGILTRERQPKASAHVIRKRYLEEDKSSNISTYCT